jgi:outer membrane protein assembly factor BamB
MNSVANFALSAFIAMSVTSFAPISLLPLTAADSSPWPTIHRDNQRSGYTDQIIAAPYERKWFANFSDEMIATRVEAILGDDKCFVGTFAGRLYALDVASGKTIWSFAAGGAIGASPCYGGGRIYFGSDDGNLYCLNSQTGRELWRYAAGAGIWVAPAWDGRAIYFGDRGGTFHAIDAQTGKRQWQFHTAGMILTPASVTPHGDRIVFGSEDMHVYCLGQEGKLLWKSAMLGGLSLRDHAPTLWKDLAIVTTNPARDFHSTPGESPAILTAVQKSLPMEPDDKVIFDKWGSYTMKLTPRRLAAEQQAVREYLAENRPERTFYALDLKDGSEPWIAPILYTGGLHNPPTPPTFDPKTGELYVWTPTALSNYSAGVPGGAIAVAKLDRDSGLTQILWHTNGDKLGWAFDFAAPADEAQALSLMGSFLLNTHQGIIGGMDRRTLKWHHIYIARDTYGGIFGAALVPGSFKGAEQAHAQGQLTLMPNEWHGPDRGIASIGYGRIFWVTGSQVVCLGGADTPRMETGGTTAPPPIQRKTIPVVPGGNVAAGFVGRMDVNVAAPRITPQMLQKYLNAPATVAHEDDELSRSLRRKLDAAILELIGSHWAPFIIELGISHEERYFWRASQTMQMVALALPHLSPDVRARVEAYLDDLFKSGAPLQQVTVRLADARRREPYDLGRTMSDFAAALPPYRANIEDVYALWAYAHYAQRWEQVLAQWPRVLAVYEEFDSKPAAFDDDDRGATDAAEHLNGQIAGTLAYARIAQKAGDQQQVTRALDRLAMLVVFRVHHEQADTRFIRISGKQAHSANLPRYLDMVPESARMLRDLAGDAFKKNATALSAQLPTWHHAFGERLIGGENYISPPTLSRALFIALSDGLQEPPTRIAPRLDQPWCKADLYYIEKLTAVLRLLDS